MAGEMSSCSSRDSPSCRSLLRYVALSRVFYLFLQLVGNLLLPDHVSDAFQSPCHVLLASKEIGFVEAAVGFLFSGYARWDAQYFLHVATVGYTHENCLAFFPLFPVLTKAVALLLGGLVPVFTNSWLLALLGAWIVSNAAFTVAALELYKLTLKVTGDGRFSLLVFQVFCIAPATIFFTAPYSESLFCMLSFACLNSSISGNFIEAGLLAGLSAATRSNGLLNGGLLACFWLSHFILKGCHLILKSATVLFTSLALSIIPFIAYQWYAYSAFCTPHSVDIPEAVERELVARGLVMRGSGQPAWCHNTLPLSYTSVQSQYWNVGLFRYFELKQIPNFVLAAPTLLLTGFYSLLWLQNQTRKMGQGQHAIFQARWWPFAGHAAFLSIFCFFGIHVQVSTRLIGSASPAIYWIMAWLLKESGSACDLKSLLVGVKKPLVPRSVVWYCVIYVVVGTVAFVNHLPWT